MPYYDGKRISLEEWQEIHSKPNAADEALDKAFEAADEAREPNNQAKADKPTASKAKRAAKKAAAEAATGEPVDGLDTDIEIDGDIVENEHGDGFNVNDVDGDDVSDQGLGPIDRDGDGDVDVTEADTKGKAER